MLKTCTLALAFGCAVAGVSLEAASANASQPQFFSQQSSQCGAEIPPVVTASPNPGANEQVGAEVVFDGAAEGDLYPNEDPSTGVIGFNGQDQAWLYVGKGRSESVEIPCSPDSVAYQVNFFQLTSPPISFTGLSSYDDGDLSSQLPFDVQLAGDYRARISVTQGAININNASSGWNSVKLRTVAVSGSTTLDLGPLSRGLGAVNLTARPGPQAEWSIAVEHGKSSLKDVHTGDVGAGQNGIDFGLTGAAKVSAYVYHSGSRKRIATLLRSRSYGSGLSAVRWLPKRRPPAGRYVVRFTAVDAWGDVSKSSVKIRLNSFGDFF